MKIENFPLIGIGDTFVVDGEAFKKQSELVYTDSVGIERYIDPLFDAKIKGPSQKAPAKPVAPAAQDAPAAAQADVRLSDDDVERIARRVAQLLGGKS